MLFGADSVALKLHCTVISKWEATNYLWSQDTHTEESVMNWRWSRWHNTVWEPVLLWRLIRAGRWCLHIFQQRSPSSGGEEEMTASFRHWYTCCWIKIRKAANPSVKYLQRESSHSRKEARLKRCKSTATGRNPSRKSAQCAGKQCINSSRQRGGTEFLEPKEFNLISELSDRHWDSYSVTQQPVNS